MMPLWVVALADLWAALRGRQTLTALLRSSARTRRGRLALTFATVALLLHLADGAG